MTFLENGTKVYALNPKSFVFVREKSAGDPEVDIVRTINIPYVVSHVCPGGQPHCGSELPVFGLDTHFSRIISMRLCALGCIQSKVVSLATCHSVGT